MKTVAVSVIIPAYNQAGYLGSAIQSVMDQAYSDFEVVVVDDGSTDDTPNVVARFDDHRLRYIRQENRGLSAARNTGICASSSRLVTFLDSDDLFLPCKLVELTAALRGNPELGLVAGQFVRADAAGTPIGDPVGHLPPTPIDLLFGNPFHVGSILVKREWLGKVGLFDERLRACEDWDLWLRLAIAGCRMGWIDRPVSVYRIHRMQMTGEPERMRTAMLAMLEKVFNTPQLEQSWQNAKAEAYARAYATAAAREYRGGMLVEARSDLARAVAMHPRFSEGNGSLLEDFLFAWAYDPATADPAAYLRSVYENLPASLKKLARRKRHVLARVFMKEAFDRFREGDLPGAASSARCGIRYAPGWLANRGVISILLRSVAGEVRG